MNRQVAVEETVREVTYIRPDGAEELLGKIVMEDYSGEVKRFTFRPSEWNPFAPANKKEKGYLLGTGSRNMDFINPAEAQKAVIDRGLHIQEQFAYKGGLMMKTMFIDPDKRMEDIFDYDYDFWAKQRRTDKGVFNMIDVSTNLQIGFMAARFTQGLYRTVCTNGLISTILSLPTISVRHTEWEVSNVHGRLAEVDFGTPDKFMGLTKGLVTKRHLQSVINMMNRHREESERPLGLSAEMQMLENNFGYLANRKNSTLEGYSEQLQLAVDNIDEFGEVNGLHLINAYTNAVNVSRLRGSDRGTFTALDDMNTVLTQTVSAANLAGIFGAN